MHVHNMILDVVEEAPVKSPLKMWCQRLLTLDYRPEILRQRYKDLSSCFVEEVLHYRQEGPIAHELVVVAIRSGDDRRVIRLERFKQDRADDSSSYVPWSFLVSELLTCESDGYATKASFQILKPKTALTYGSPTQWRTFLQDPPHTA
jgi:hypothetical protein